MTKHLIVISRQGNVWLDSKENLTETTINNATSKGLRLAKQKDVPDGVLLKRKFPSVKAAKRAAKKSGFEAICYQSLRQRS